MNTVFVEGNTSDEELKAIHATAEVSLGPNVSADQIGKIKAHKPDLSIV